MQELLFLALAIAVVAFLYSSVGHAGASGYIAVLSLAGYSSAVVKPTALVLNILVATIGVVFYSRAGHFSWKLFWPFALLSIPAAFLGGYLKLPTEVFKVLVGIVLLCSAAQLMIRRNEVDKKGNPPRAVAIGWGGLIGLLSGLTGTGGGIFLSPLLMFARWATTKEAAAASVLFILMNSVSGIIGFAMSGQVIPGMAWGLAVAAVAGGAVGSYLGSTRFSSQVIRAMLAVVLLIAGTKLILVL